MEVKKLYDTKAIHSLVISRSTYTRPLNKLKEQCTIQKRCSLEFIVWFDCTLSGVAKLDISVFNCILELIQKGHIVNSYYMKDFRLACIVFQKFVESDHVSNLAKVGDFLQDYSQYNKYVELEPQAPINFDSILTYDRVLANKRMFPYFYSNGVSKELIAELISRNLLAFDTRFHNLIYICKSDSKFLGIEKHGIGTKHYQQLIYKDKPVSFIYHIEHLAFADFERDIKKLMFFDNTLNMLKYLSSNYIDSQTVYCSLHTPNCSVDTFTSTIELFGYEIEIEFKFLDETAIGRFKNKYGNTDQQIEVDNNKSENSPPIAIKTFNSEEEFMAYLEDDDDLPF